MLEGMRRARQISMGQSELDANLKRAFDEMPNDHVPDKFRHLLQQLQLAEAQGNRPKGEAEEIGS
jgi:hypothetical protein